MLCHEMGRLTTSDMGPGCPLARLDKPHRRHDRFGLGRCRELATGSATHRRRGRNTDIIERTSNMGYGIGGILVLILVILAIIYFAKRV